MRRPVKIFLWSILALVLLAAGAAYVYYYFRSGGIPQVSIDKEKFPIKGVDVSSHNHDIDFARFCLGEPGQIEAVKDLGKGQFKMISSVLRFRDADAQVEGGFVTPAGYPFSRTYAAYFENGTLTSSEPGKVTEYRKEETREHDFRPDNPYLSEVQDFIRAIETGDASRICTGKDARETIRCCTQIAEEIGYPLPKI